MHRTLNTPQADLIHEVREITPQEAASLLQQVRNVAPLDQRQITTYAADMAAGVWKLNGDPIILDRAGVVLSGRLRLHACVRAERPFKTLIVRNVDPSHFDTIDAVRRRTVSDIMTIRKERDGRALAAALTVLWRFANDDFPTASKRASSQALIAILEQNPEIRRSVAVARASSPRLPHGLGAGLHFLFSRVDPSKADAFFTDLAREDLNGTAATASLKKQLDEGLEQGGQRSQGQMAGLVIKAWEAFRSGRPVSFVRFVPGNDAFPKITGLPDRVRLDGVVQSAAANDTPGHGGGVPDLRVSVEVVTPSRARAILERNDRNRAIAAAVVDKYARDMKNGAWALNGQTIKIGASGRLLDGQHRCAAAIRSNTPFQAIIVEGLDDEVFDTFDLGTRRPISAILKDRGETNTAALGAALRQVWLIENELITIKNVPPTVSEIMDTLERHPSIRESVRLGNKVRDIAPSIALALHYFFRKVNPVKADEFIDRLGDGVMLGVDSPILKLRDILSQDRINRKGRLGESERAALIIKAWNYFLYDRPVRLLKWQTAGVRRESFPAIAGLAQSVAA